jgi:diguanylate cyclase (GGDEF)-like protein
MTAIPAPRRRTLGRPAAWQWWAAAGLAGVVLYFVVGSLVARDLTYSAIGLASTVTLVVAIRVRTPARRWGWYLIAIANVCFVLGDAVGNLYDLALRSTEPFPSFADAFYLSGYPFLFAGVLKVSRPRNAPRTRETWADAAMVSLGALAVSWQFLMRSYLHENSLSQFGKLVTLTYPVMDLGVLFIVVTAVMTGAARRPADKILGLAITLMLIGDVSYDLLLLHGSYTAGNPVDAGFLLYYVGIAAAALHPSATVKLAGAETGPVRLRVWIPLVAAAGFASPLMVGISSALGRQVDAGPLAATTILLFTLAVLRATWMFGRLRDQTAQLEQNAESLRVALATQQELQDNLRYQAFHDNLTGLANRALLHDRVEHALEASSRRSGSVAVFFCDLDGFKGVNDSLGHHVGDQLLILASQRLTSIVRSSDTVARLGGDEFAVLLDNVADIEAVTSLAARIVSVLHEPVVIDGQHIHLSVSVGVAFALSGTTTETLLSEADAAMYDAKAGGKDRFSVFETVMRSRIIDRMTMTSSLQGSLQRDEFFLEYQPQLRLADGVLEGFEALVRWQHPALGLVGPYRFIPVAEETGFIVALGRWVLEHACREAAQWSQVRGESLSVSVNVSGRQLQDANLLADVRGALASSGLPPEQLILEITESVLVLNPQRIAEVLRQLREMGIRIAIDDFGTGYSSLSYLRQFPVDVLKIDKSFVDPLAIPGSQGAAFVETILRLAADLHLEATAEGIEHESQRDTLVRLNCHSAQGYLMSRPLSSAAALAYIDAAAGS